MLVGSSVQSVKGNTSVEKGFLKKVCLWCEVQLVYRHFYSSNFSLFQGVGY